MRLPGYAVALELGFGTDAAGVMAFDGAMLSGMGPPGRARVVGTESAGGVPGVPAWDRASGVGPSAIDSGGARTIGSSGTEVTPGCVDMPGRELAAVAVAVAVPAIAGDGDITDCVGIA